MGNMWVHWDLNVSSAILDIINIGPSAKLCSGYLDLVKLGISCLIQH